MNKNTVLCSSAGYGSSFLKVLIPQLAEYTLLNHRNIGADAPCVAAGSCILPGGQDADKLIDPAHPTEKADVKIDVSRLEELDTVGNKQVCHVTLIEDIETHIRGRRFVHHRSLPLTDRDVADCFAK